MLGRSRGHLGRPALVSAPAAADGSWGAETHPGLPAPRFEVWHLNSFRTSGFPEGMAPRTVASRARSLEALTLGWAPPLPHPSLPRALLLGLPPTGTVRTEVLASGADLGRTSPRCSLGQLREKLGLGPR